MKLELGSGNRPTRGYDHCDNYTTTHIEWACDPWMIDLPDRSLEEVLALAFIEHLTHDQAMDTFRNVHRMLHHGGLFLFDVPDYPRWCEFYLKQISVEREPLYTDVPSLEHCRKTLFGWQRWPGDEHKWGWDKTSLQEALHAAGFTAPLHDDVTPFISRTYRNRFHNPVDAHIYVVATK